MFGIPIHTTRCEIHKSFSFERFQLRAGGSALCAQLRQLQGRKRFQLVFKPFSMDFKPDRDCGMGAACWKSWLQGIIHPPSSQDTAQAQHRGFSRSKPLKKRVGTAPGIALGQPILAFSRGGQTFHRGEKSRVWASQYGFPKGTSDSEHEFIESLPDLSMGLVIPKGLLDVPSSNSSTDSYHREHSLRNAPQSLFCSHRLEHSSWEGPPAIMVGLTQN